MEKHPECEIFLAPFDVRLDMDQWTMVQPDVFIVCNREQITRRRLEGAPGFVIEILSPSNRSHDLFRKLNKYRFANVREYWVVDPESREVIVYDLENEKLPERYSFKDEIPVLISEGECSVDFKRIEEKVKDYL